MATRPMVLHFLALVVIQGVTALVLVLPGLERVDLVGYLWELLLTTLAALGLEEKSMFLNMQEVFNENVNYQGFCY